MFTPLILFFGLTVATAVIAHWSDNLGKKLGKKRVSLLGLRPRTTATVLTIASSWCIMLFTLAALLIAVAPLRRMLFSYDAERAQAQSDREQAKIDIVAARGLLGTTRAKFGAATLDLSAARQELVEAKASVQSSIKDARIAKEQGQRAEAAQKKRAEAARERANEAEKEVRSAQTRVVDAQRRFVAAQKRVVIAQRRVETALQREELAQSKARGAENQSQAARRATKLAQSQTKKAGKDEMSAREAYYAARRSLKSTEQRTAQLEQKNRLLEDENKVIEATNNELRAQRSEYEAVTNFLVKTDAPVKFGQVFAARQIVANQAPEVIVAQLRDLIQQGRQFFAESDETEPNFPADANLELVPLETSDTNGRVVVLQDEAHLRFLANAIRRQTTANLISVRLLAVRNYLAGEKYIGVKFDFVPVKPAFGAGEVIATAVIDGAQGDARIFSSLLDLIGYGETEARKRGVDPTRSFNETRFFVAGTNVKIFEALRLLANSKSRLSVNLIADRALTTVEPLQVRFEIEAQPIS